MFPVVVRYLVGVLDLARLFLYLVGVLDRALLVVLLGLDVGDVTVVRE